MLLTDASPAGAHCLRGRLSGRAWGSWTALALWLASLLTAGRAVAAEGLTSPDNGRPLVVLIDGITLGDVIEGKADSQSMRLMSAIKTDIESSFLLGANPGMNVCYQFAIHRRTQGSENRSFLECTYGRDNEIIKIVDSSKSSEIKKLLQPPPSNLPGARRLLHISAATDKTRITKVDYYYLDKAKGQDIQFAPTTYENGVLMGEGFYSRFSFSTNNIKLPIQIWRLKTCGATGGNSGVAWEQRDIRVPERTPWKSTTEIGLPEGCYGLFRDHGWWRRPTVERDAPIVVWWKETVEGVPEPTVQVQPVRVRARRVSLVGGGGAALLGGAVLLGMGINTHIGLSCLPASAQDPTYMCLGRDLTDQRQGVPLVAAGATMMGAGAVMIGLAFWVDQ